MARNTMLDLNGDGRADIPWFYLEFFGEQQDPDPTHLAYWATTGSGFEWTYLGYVGTEWTAASGGDFANDDAYLDVLFVQQDTRDVGFWDVREDNQIDWVYLGQYGAGYEQLDGYSLDMTGDGTDDVLFVNRDTGDIGYWDLDDGAVSGWTSLGVASDYQNEDGLYWSVEGGGDFNGDGRADLFWYSFRESAGAHATGMWRTEDNGAATWVGLPNVDEEWEPEFAETDLNGDGNVDILWLNEADESDEGAAIGFWDLSSGGAEWTYVGAGAPEWLVTGTGDYTGDGTADILFRNDLSGDFGFWDLDAGGVYAGWVYVGNDAPGDNWFAEA